MAYRLLVKKKEKKVCVFERETKIGGRIFDYRFKEDPNILVGKLQEKVSEILIINVIDYSLQKWLLKKRDRFYKARRKTVSKFVTGSTKSKKLYTVEIKGTLWMLVNWFTVLLWASNRGYSA